jgi:hypothetical protein
MSSAATKTMSSAATKDLKKYNVVRNQDGHIRSVQFGDKIFTIGQTFTIPNAQALSDFASEAEAKSESGRVRIDALIDFGDSDGTLCDAIGEIIVDGESKPFFCHIDELAILVPC